MQLKFVLAILATAVPVAVSTFVTPKPQSCGNNEFWWGDKECCLPKGGPKVLPTPPKGSNCPPTSYYWESKKGCCVPRNPPPSNPPPPQCPKNWTWYPRLWRCLPNPTPPTPPPSHPSPKPGNWNGNNNNHGNDNDDNHGNNNGHGNNNNGHGRRSLKARTTLCPTGLDACPISGLTGDYECLDTTTELESCGGCSSLGKGQDCTTMEGAWNVGCEQGSCIVYTCAGGFKIGADSRSCIPA